MTFEQRLHAFNTTRNALLDEMERVATGALLATPIAGAWSILDIIEHLVLAERAVFRELPDPRRLVDATRGVADYVRYLLVLFVLTSRVRVRVPSPAMVPRGNRGLAELRRRRDENQAWVRSCIDRHGAEVGRRMVCEHPIAGPLSLEQALVMGQIRLDGHIRQIRALQRLLT